MTRPSAWRSCALALLSLGLFDLSEGLYIPLFYQRAKRENPSSTLKLGFKRTPWKNTIQKRDATLDVDVAIDNIKIGYTVDISLGTPAQNVTVLLDTGSSDLWVSSDKNEGCTTKDTVVYNGNGYNCQMFGTFNETASSTFSPNDTDFAISYGDSTGAQGEWATDKLEVNGITVPDFSFGLGLNGTTTLGVFGIGYPLNEATYRNLNNRTDFEPYLYENLPLRLVRQGVINTPAYSLWLDDKNEDEGEVLFGAVDHSKYTGNLTRLPTQISYDMVQREFMLTLNDVKLSNDPKNKSKLDTALPALLDSGTTLSYLPEEVVDSVLNGIHGGYNTKLGSMVGQCNYTGTLDYYFDGVTIKVPYSSLLTPINATDADGLCLLGLRVTSSKRYPVILGDSFLRSAYVVFDMANNEMALAQVATDPPTESLIEVITSTIPSTPYATTNF